MPPTILLIPGAWHRPGAFEPTATQLRSLGYSVETIQLQSVGGYGSVAEDSAAIGKFVETLADKGEDILLVPHSYAGAASAGIQKEFAKARRTEAGKPGGIVGLVYVAAFLCPEGVDIKTMLRGKWEPWQIADEDKKIITVDNAAGIFYADLSPEQQEKYTGLLSHQSMTSFQSPIGHAGWSDPAYNGRRAYIHTKQDKALPPEAQQAMLSHSGVAWEVKELESSHSPMLSRTDEVVAFLDEKAKQFSA